MAYFINDECINCNSCEDICPSNAIISASDKYEIDEDNCSDCGSCTDVCPVDAIHPK